MSPADNAAEALHRALEDAHQVATDVADAAALVMPGFEYSGETYVQLNAHGRLAMDAFYHRYNSLVSVMQDRIFRSIALLEQEDPSSSRRDLTELMEKLGTISDADAFSKCAVARNDLAHKYAAQLYEQVGRLNHALSNAVILVRSFNETMDYIRRKELLPFGLLGSLAPVVLQLPRQTGDPKL